MTTLLFLPGPDAPYRWLRVDDTRLLVEGDGLPPPDGERLVAVTPADAVTLHWAALPRSVAGPGGRGRRGILASEASAAPGTELHVAVGNDGGAERPIAVVGASAMRAWLLELASAGIDPDAMIPAPLLLPRPDEGFARARAGRDGCGAWPDERFCRRSAADRAGDRRGRAAHVGARRGR